MTGRTLWAAPLLTAALLYLSYFPVAAGWLAWIALVPLLSLVRLPRTAGWLYLATWVGGVAFFLPVLQWARVADPRMYYTWIALSLLCSLTFPVTLFLLRRLDSRTPLPLVVSLPCVVVGLELVRWGFTGGFASLLLGSYQHDYPGGFSWYFLGHTQHDFLELVQIADLTGVAGISFLVAAANALIFEILYSRERFRLALFGADAPAGRTKPALLAQGLGVAGLLLASLAYGVWQMGQPTTPGPRIALLQGNHPQGVRNDATNPDEEASAAARATMRGDYHTLCYLAVRHRAELLVWPETSFPDAWVELRPGTPDPESQRLAERFARSYNVPTLLGTTGIVVGEDRKARQYNSAVLLGKDGRLKGRYDKVHRVPFGEYIPMRSLLPFLNRFAPYDYDFAVEPGEAFTRFRLGGDDATSFGVVICYEDTDPALARTYVRGEDKVDFLLNTSNDGWFDGTSEHDQHLALCRFRAVECRRSVGRAVNMGISAIIDPCGRVLAPRTLESETYLVWEVPEDAGSLPVSEWHRYKKIPGVLIGRVPLGSRGSFYAEHGDWFAGLCVLPVLASLLPWRRGSHDVRGTT